MQYKWNKALELNQCQGSKEKLPYMLHNTYWNTDSNDLETRGLPFPPFCLSQNVFCYWRKMLSSKTLKNWYHFLAVKWSTDSKYFMIWFHKFFFSLLLPCRFDCCNTGDMLATESSSKDHDGCQAQARLDSLLFQGIYYSPPHSRYLLLP